MEEQTFYEIPIYKERPEDFLKSIEKKDIVCSWDIECGCPMTKIKEEVQKIQQKFDLKPDEGYITTFTDDYETTFMIFSVSWISQEEAKQFWKQLRKTVEV
jgi:hypothetical protein